MAKEPYCMIKKGEKMQDYDVFICFEDYPTVVAAKNPEEAKQKAMAEFEAKRKKAEAQAKVDYIAAYPKE
jgi:hypothetical protein